MSLELELNRLKADFNYSLNRYKKAVKVFETYVVAFNVSENVQWLNSGYSPNRTEFNRSLENGTAMNLTNISNTKKYRWDWLYNWVANIDDIISDNEGTSLE